MKIIPAIDLNKGKCVRLYQGNFHNQTIYEEDPLKTAEQFKKEGAEWLHVIDLGGAKEGRPVHLDVIKNIKKQTGLKLEVGGGVRSIESIQNMLDLGIERIIIGTLAINNPDMVSYLKNNNIIISVDANKGMVAIKGWQIQTNVPATEVIEKFSTKGISDYIYTDIERDGTMTSPNFKEIKKIREKFRDIDLTIAGGIATVEDVEKLNQLKINWAIVGKAIFANPELRSYVSQKNYTLS